MGMDTLDPTISLCACSSCWCVRSLETRFEGMSDAEEQGISGGSSRSEEGGAGGGKNHSKYRKDKPWDNASIDHWSIPNWQDETMKVSYYDAALHLPLNVAGTPQGAYTSAMPRRNPALVSSRRGWCAATMAHATTEAVLWSSLLYSATYTITSTPIIVGAPRQAAPKCSYCSTHRNQEGSMARGPYSGLLESAQWRSCLTTNERRKGGS